MNAADATSIVDDVAGYIASAAGPTSYAFAMLGALQSKPVYAGTVDPAVKAKRRAKAKRAKAARKAQR